MSPDAQISSNLPCHINLVPQFLLALDLWADIHLHGYFTATENDGLSNSDSNFLDLLKR